MSNFLEQASLKFRGQSKWQRNTWAILFSLGIASVSILTSAHAGENPYGIGTLVNSNQIEFERFEGSFYLAWNPLTLQRRSLRSDNDAYSSTLDSDRMNGINLGVRHSIASFGHFALLGDYGVSINWLKAAFTSDSAELTSSSTTSNLLAVGLSPSLLLAYFLTDKIHPFVGLASTFVYSRLQAPLAGGDNEYFELHYGPAVGLQIVNLPFQQLFFSAEWIQSLKQKENAQRLYADNGHAQIAVGLNF